MTEEERARFAEELAGLDAADAAVRAARKPFDDAILAIDDVKENLLEKHEVDIAGHCEACNRLLFVGDLGHWDDDGNYLCEEDAPTWGDAKRYWEQARAEDTEDDSDAKEALAAIEARLAAGTGLDDKRVFPL